ncbi:MAG: NAD(P)/FAD-dependent oxidoreductase, partial [Chloroflexota bacterium]
MYDVIIVGGRVAGSTLATRLAPHNLNVLLLERDTLPSLPAASSPIIYAPAMTLLDEIGADEYRYAANTPRITQWIVEARDAFRVAQPVPMVDGRDYAYAVDRARFDGALWEHSAAMPGVDARLQHAVTDLLWEGDRVCGVQAKNITTGEMHEFHAPIVVGADGRFGIVARKVNAATHSEHNDEPTTNYYAYWRDVSPVDANTATAYLFSTGGDYGFLVMDSADDSTLIAIEGRSDGINAGRGGAEQFYHDFVNRHPEICQRLQGAQRITPVRGMKRIGNLYRQAGGPGWALVGDAVHQKDPLDGQGIYDALFTAKALAQSIAASHSGSLSWAEAVTQYEQTVLAETLPMYHATLGRVHREIYTRRPQWFMKTMARWLYEDERYREHWATLFVRQTDPETWFTHGRTLLPMSRSLAR